ncbi:MAG: class I SAM-dependent methyltransferase [Acidimicrobiia bacterium]
MEERHWFEDVADHLGEAYLRYSFTKGTDQEVGFLVEELGLAAGMRVLDVGCGPGRHAHALARSGIEVVGVDISERFVDLARQGASPGATFVRGDARALAYDAEFDAVISLCQGAFGLSDGPGSPVDPDASVLAGMARALRPGGRLALSAFSAYFQVRHLDDITSFDAGRGVQHEVFEVRDEESRTAEHDGWTTCFTPRELRLMMAAAGLETVGLWSVDPGDYARRPPDLDHAEFLAIARRA